MYDSTSKAIRDWFVAELPPSLRRFVKYNIQHQERQQAISMEKQQYTTLQTELTDTRRALADTINRASEKIDNLQSELDREKIWKWIGLGIGVLGILVGILR